MKQKMNKYIVMLGCLHVLIQHINLHVLAARLFCKTSFEGVLLDSGASVNKIKCYSKCHSNMHVEKYYVAIKKSIQGKSSAHRHSGDGRITTVCQDVYISLATKINRFDTPGQMTVDLTSTIITPVSTRNSSLRIIVCDLNTQK